MSPFRELRTLFGPFRIVVLYANGRQIECPRESWYFTRGAAHQRALLLWNTEDNPDIAGYAVSVGKEIVFSAPATWREGSGA